MTITLIPLPYAEAALQPHISAETLKLHHGAHHKGYVEKTNDATSGTELAGQPLEAIIRAAEKDGNAALFNSAAQTWNHGFYWHSLTPDSAAPGVNLEAAIIGNFGSLENCTKALAAAADDHFGSGWAWLVSEGGTISVITTHDAGSPVTGTAVPLLTIDVWEHAYYLDTKNHRPDYVTAVIENCLNWSFADENFARATCWVYPA